MRRNAKKSIESSISITEYWTKIGTKNDAPVKITRAQNIYFSFLSWINLLRYCVENKSAVLWSMKVENEKIIAIEAPMIPALAKPKPCNSSGDGMIWKISNPFWIKNNAIQN